MNLNEVLKKAMLAAIIDSSHDAIISKDLKGMITSWNKSAEKLFGYKEQEVIGKHISILIPKERLEEENVIISKICKGEKVDHFETIRVDKYGNEIPISLTISPIKDEQDKIIGASKIARDISEQIETRKKIDEYNRQLEQANRYKDEFIGIASHELKTPLTSIYGYLQLLERTLNDEKSKDFARKTIRQVSKLNDLVSDLLDISKIQSGKLQLNINQFSLNELVSETVEIAHQMSGSHTFEIIAGTENILIFADKQRLEQVILNLLSNAIKYSPKADRIIVTTTSEREFIKISIRDFGIGIPVSEQEKIFSRFYRVEGSEAIYSGLGIGLYISNEIVQMHNGELKVESDIGKGSTFHVYLPIEYK